jgi:hypothetical protein
MIHFVCNRAECLLWKKETGHFSLITESSYICAEVSVLKTVHGAVEHAENHVSVIVSNSSRCSIDGTKCAVSFIP